MNEARAAAKAVRVVVLAVGAGILAGLLRLVIGKAVEAPLARSLSLGGALFVMFVANEAWGRRQGRTRVPRGATLLIALCGAVTGALMLYWLESWD